MTREQPTQAALAAERRADIAHGLLVIAGAATLIACAFCVLFWFRSCVHVDACMHRATPAECKRVFGWP